MGGLFSSPKLPTREVDPELERLKAEEAARRLKEAQNAGNQEAIKKAAAEADAAGTEEVVVVLAEGILGSREI